MLAILNLHDHSHVAWCQQQIKPGQSLRNSMALGRVIRQKISTWVYAFLAFATSPSLHKIKTHGVMETGSMETESMEAESSWVIEAGSIWEYQQIKLKHLKTMPWTKNMTFWFYRPCGKQKTPTKQPAKSLVQPNAAASGRQEKNRKPSVEDLNILKWLPNFQMCFFFCFFSTLCQF